MTKRFWRGLALLLVVPGLLFVASCAKKPLDSEPGVSAEQTDAERRAAEERRALEDERLREERLREEARRRAEIEQRERFENEKIYFEFDKARLLPEAQQILKAKATWLSANPNVSVVIEGHCDERGTAEYNMALGDRRAQSAKNFLVDLGIASSRLTTVSYGEETPVDPGHNEAAWAKNRRAEFVID